jgi:hypothetical protein
MALCHASGADLRIPDAVQASVRLALRAVLAEHG